MQGLSRHILSAAAVSVGLLFAGPALAAHHDHGDRGGHESFSRHSSGGHSSHSNFNHHNNNGGHLTSHQRERVHDFRQGQIHGFNHAERGERSHDRGDQSRAFNRGFHQGYRGTAHAARHGNTHAVRHAFHRFHGDVRHFSVRDRAIWTHGGWRHTRWHGRFGWWWVAGGSWYFYDSPVYPYPGYVSATYYDGGGYERCYDEDGYYRYGNDYDGDGYCDYDNDSYDDDY